MHCFGLEDELGQDIEAVVEEEEEIDFLCLWQVRSSRNTWIVGIYIQIYPNIKNGMVPGMLAFIFKYPNIKNDSKKNPRETLRIPTSV